MGFTGYGYPLPCEADFYSDFQHRLARWINAPTTGLELIVENIVRNYHFRSRSLRLSFPCDLYTSDSHNRVGPIQGKVASRNPVLPVKFQHRTELEPPRRTHHVRIYDGRERVRVAR